MRRPWRPRSDAELATRALAGSADAAEELVRRHWEGAWRAAVFMTGDRALAEDVVQDAFERALRALGSFDTARPFAPWLHRIVANRAQDLLTRARVTLALDEDLLGGPDPYSSADDTAELIAALADLSPDRRSVVVLRLLFGYTPAELAEVLEIEVGTVHSRLSRALSELRARIEVHGEV